MHVVLIFALLAAVPSHAQLSVGLGTDGIALAGSASLAAFSLALPASTEAMPVSLGAVNSFDRLVVLPYSRPLDVASDVATYASLLLPVALGILVPQDQVMALGVVYAEVMSEAFFAKNAGKYLVHRVRPWLYRVEDGGSSPDVWEGNDSFPSGHATLAFAAAAFGVVTAWLELPGTSPWRTPLMATEAGLAVVAASLRVLSGMHFMTDVLAGAAIGSLIGVLLPLAHSAYSGPTLGSTAVAPKVLLPLVTVSY